MYKMAQGQAIVFSPVSSIQPLLHILLLAGLSTFTRRVALIHLDKMLLRDFTTTGKTNTFIFFITFKWLTLIKINAKYQSGVMLLPVVFNIIQKRMNMDILVKFSYTFLHSHHFDVSLRFCVPNRCPRAL